jgi:hypothetical protein
MDYEKLAEAYAKEGKLFKALVAIDLMQKRTEWRCGEIIRQAVTDVLKVANLPYEVARHSRGYVVRLL